MSMRSVSVALYSRGLAIGRDAITPTLRADRGVGAGALADDDERRAAGRLPLRVEHLPGPAELPPGRGVERDHAAVARIERDGDLVVAERAIELERQHEPEQHGAPLRQLALEVGLRAADRVRLEAAGPRDVAQRAQPDAALGRFDLARQLVDAPLKAPRARDHRERGEAAVALRLLPHDGRRRGAKPAIADLGRTDGPRAAGVLQADAAAGRRDRERDHAGRSASGRCSRGACPAHHMISSATRSSTSAAPLESTITTLPPS